MSINYEQVVADSQECHLPDLLRRSLEIRRASGNALAVIGMRRSGLNKKMDFVFLLIGVSDA